MDLQYTLQRYALQLKNTPRTLVVSVACVLQKMMKTLYDTHFPNAENRRPGRTPECPDSDILAIGWLLEYITENSENAGYPRLKAALKSLFPFTRAVALQSQETQPLGCQRSASPDFG